MNAVERGSREEGRIVRGFFESLDFHFPLFSALCTSWDCSGVG